MTVVVPCWAGVVLIETGVPYTPKPSFGGVPLGRMLTPPAGVLLLATAASRMLDDECPDTKSPRTTLEGLGPEGKSSEAVIPAAGKIPLPWFRRTPSPLSIELLGASSVTAMS